MKLRCAATCEDNIDYRTQRPEPAQGVACLRKEHLLVRYGGEEFCILLPGVEISRAKAMAERSREAVEEAKFAHNGVGLKFTVSIGVAGLSNSGDKGVETLVSRADETLYAAKKAGRNRVVSFPSNTTLGLLMMSRR